MTKIYTKRGDLGETDLFGAGRVRKDDPRVEAYGTVDECNAAIGMALSALGKGSTAAAGLERVQHALFNVGSELAAPGMLDKLPLVSAEDVAHLEREIDAAQATLPALKHFILPGGAPAASALHLARTIARRAERLVVALVAGHGVRVELVTYLNRLSDYLFVMARVVNHEAGVAETIWVGRG